MKSHQSGYILFITFSMLALCTALVSAFMVKGFTHKRLASALLQQDQLSQFVLSTPALAQSFLAFSADEVNHVGQEGIATHALKMAATDGDSGFGRLLLERVLPVMNKTQTIDFKNVEKDFPVAINLTFFCESGKINLNGLYDLVQKKFYDEGIAGKDKKVFATWLFDKIAAITGKKSLLQPFIDHVKQRTSGFNDVTELLAIKEFSDCFSQTVFYETSTPDEKLEKKVIVYLTDIFTVVSENDTIQPWLLSPSVCALLDIVQADSKQSESGKQEDKKIDLSSFKQQSDWRSDWDAGPKTIYGISFDKVPESVQGAFATQFQVSVFSMMATVVTESMTVKIFAILKQRRLPDSSVAYDVIKIYQV